IDAVFRGAKLRVERRSVTHDGATFDTIVGDRQGTDPNRIVIVCAHYDAVAHGPGADDNASGVAGLFAMARASAGVAIGASLRLIAFPFEEEGLVASSVYASALGPVEKQRIVAVLDLEMIGFTAQAQSFPPGIEAFADEPIPTRGDFLAVVG